MNSAKRPYIHFLAMATVIVILLFGVWLWAGRKNGSEPLSDGYSATDRQEKAKAYSSEWARRLAVKGGTNNLASASEAFRESRHCVLYYAALREIASELNDERLDDISGESLATLEDADATTRRYLLIVNQTKALCAGSDQRAVENVYIEAILKAALLGDPDAEGCFVLSGATTIFEDERSAESVAALEDRYLKYAPIFMQKALERADPYVAARALYQYTASPPVHPSKLDNLPRADPYLTWRAARLALLRATPEHRARMERRLEALQQQHVLQPDAIKNADDWARATYERDFAGQSALDLDSEAPCYPALNL